MAAAVYDEVRGHCARAASRGPPASSAVSTAPRWPPSSASPAPTRSWTCLPLPPGGAMEREIRGCAVHAGELLARQLGVPPRTLDNWLWNRGQAPPYSERPAHLTETVFY